MSDIQLKLGGRRTGRTTEMLDWLIEGEPDEKRAIVTFSLMDAERLYKLARKQCPSVEPWQFTSFRADKKKFAGRKVSEVGIDNLEFFLDFLTGINAPVTKVTGTLAEDSRYGHQRGFVVEVNTESVLEKL